MADLRSRLQALIADIKHGPAAPAVEVLEEWARRRKELDAELLRTPLTARERQDLGREAEHARALLTSAIDRTRIAAEVARKTTERELLAVGADDIDWAGLRIWVVSKGSRARQDIPVDPEAFVYLARYLARAGMPAPGQPVLRTLRGEARPLSYWALRRVLQRANDRLGTNWTWHDLRHTAAIRLVGDAKLTLPEVQRILRHANLSTLGVYTGVRIEDMFDRIQEHYARPRPQVSYPVGYDAADVAVVFGG
ncbi:tyrosine-type recombinase/integrase [Nocardia thailandica]|uniref:tyrosine-type recombinase/integrase n=1 Tax=Nocardia thailandica TaxID=257275 RepID=UPI0009FFB641|nr:site-specific integrase [Nocardia thailandica]